MPTLSNSNLPSPKSWEEFEEITLDALKAKWDSPNLQKNGRIGQAQAGVDIYGYDNLYNQAGIQCKKYDKELTLKIINEEIANAEKFTPSLDVLYFATTQPNDARLQKEIRMLSKERVSEGKFPVSIFFWNDIAQEIISSEILTKKHFPQLFNEGSKNIHSKKLYSILDLAFYGLNIDHYETLLYGEMGVMVQEDPLQMEIVTGIVETASLSILNQSEYSKVINATKEYIDYVIPYVTGKKIDNFHWRHATEIAIRITKLVKMTDNTFRGKELLAFTIGEELANWERFEVHKRDPYQAYDDERIEKLKRLIESLNDGTIPDVLSKLFEKYEKDKDWAPLHLPFDLYKTIRKILIESEIMGSI